MSLHPETFSLPVEQEKRLADLVLIWAILFGTLVRLTPAILGHFPVLDGGLFYTMVQDLQTAHYALPTYTSYNAAGIPFMYPPLPFYVGAALADLLHLPLLELFRWLPGLLCAVTVPLFYGLSRTVLPSRLASALATLAFAMLPSAYDLFIEGGGLTRSLGAIFALLTLWAVYRLFSQRRLRNVFFTILAASLLVLSHPELTFHTCFVVALLWLFLGRDKRTALLALAVAAGVLGLTLPWWLTVLQRHGWMPLRATMSTSWHNWLFWTPLLTLNFAQEFFFSPITVVALIGGLACLIQRHVLLPAWLVLPFIAEPRNPAFSATLPLALLFGVGMTAVILPGLTALARPRTAAQLPPAEPRVPQGVLLTLTVFLIYTLINAYAASMSLAQYRVTPAERQALQWVTEQTPTDARFVLLTYGDPFNTPVQEWFPTLTRRVNVAVVQGYEWLPGQLYHRKQAFDELRTCLFEALSCLEQWAARQNITYDYVYLYRGFVGDTKTQNLAGLLLTSLEASPDYTLVYDTPAIKIFARQPAAP